MFVCGFIFGFGCGSSGRGGRREVMGVFIRHGILVVPLIEKEIQFASVCCMLCYVTVFFHVSTGYEIMSYEL